MCEFQFRASRMKLEFRKNLHSNDKQIRREGVPLSQPFSPLKISNQSSIYGNRETRRGDTLFNPVDEPHRETKARQAMDDKIPINRVISLHQQHIFRNASTRNECRLVPANQKIQDR
jgi:hypothetical protein